MLKFKFLLWVLTKLLNRAVKSNPECARFIGSKELDFQICSSDGAGRLFTIRDGAVDSRSAVGQPAQFTMTFRNAARGFVLVSTAR